MRIDEAILSTAFRYFAAVAAAGSVRAAARELNIAASAINRQVLMLEEALGLSLFERTGRAMVPTEAGELLLAACRDTLQDYEEVLAAVDALKGLKRGKVRLASVETVSVNLLPQLIAAFRERYPGIEVVLTVTGSDPVTSLVERREADLGFTFNPQSLEGLEIAWSQALPIGAVMAPDHPLAGRSALTVADCLAHPYALPAHGLSLRAALEQVMRHLRERPRPAIEANSLRVMADLAASGGLVAFQPRIGIELQLASGSLKFVRLTDPALPADEFMLVRPARRPASAAAEAFFRHALEGVRTWPVF